MLQLILTILIFFLNTLRTDYLLEWQHLYIVNIDQAPKLLKIKMNSNVRKSGYNLRNKFQVNRSLRIHNHYGEATFVYFYSKFINNLNLKNFYIIIYIKGQIQKIKLSNSLLPKRKTLKSRLYDNNLP